MQTTLLNVYEVKKYSKISDLACDIQDIYQIEQREARLNIGETFYKLLIDDLVNYSTTAEWTPGSYNEDDTVKYKGLIKIALRNTTQEPSGLDWAIAPKFSEACYEAFFTGYLGRYLALCVAKNSVVPMSANIEAQGIVEKFDNNFRPVSDQKIDRSLRWFEANIAMIFDNMKSFACKSTACSKTLESFGLTECCETCHKIEIYCTCKKARRQTIRIG